MKHLSIIALLAAFTFASGQTIAQSVEENSIKILPGKNANMIKVLYTANSSSPVEVRFSTKEGIVGYDKIKNQPAGFLKKYDVKHINKHEYWVEVSSANTSVTYHIVPTKDNTLSAYLEKRTVKNSTIIVSKD
jgi:hypothetical protein